MISLLTKIYMTLSLKKVTLYVLTALSALILFTAFEQRDRIFGLTMNDEVLNNVGLTFTVSKKTEAETVAAIRGFPAISAVAIMSADLRSNEAKTVFYFNAKDPDGQLGSISRYPIFSTQEESNAEAIQLINGEFTCTAFGKTPIAKLIPEMANTVKTTCRISNPSYYGYFSGFITIFLETSPDSIQQEQIKLIFSSLATHIYFKDVIPTQRTTAGKTP